MEENSTTNDSVFAAIAVVLAAFAYIYNLTKYIDLDMLLHDFLTFITKFIAYTSIFLAFCLLIVLIYRKRNKAKEKNQEFRSNIKNLVKSNFNSLYELKKARSELNNLIEANPKHKNKILIKDVKNKLNKIKKDLEYKEELEKERISEEKEEEIYIKDITNKLVKYFEKKNSCEAIPKWALELDSDMIEEAVDNYNNIKQEKERKEIEWDEVVNFILKNKAYPINFNQLKYEEQSMYKRALRLLKQKKLQKPAEILEEDKELVKKRFFHADDLTAKQRDRFMNNYGFRHKPLIYLDGRSGNNLIIKNDPKKESDYHFCLKHLFTELYKNAIVEYCMGNLRADVVYNFNNNKIALEIETGSNNDLQLEQKVDWLNKNFDYWVFVCSRKNEKRYKKYVDNKKSFCLTLKAAYLKVKEFAAVLKKEK